MADVPSIVIIGMGALTGEDGEAVLAAAMRLAEKTGSKFLVLHTAAGRVGAMDVGFTTEGGIDAALDGADVIYALGVDEIDLPGAPGDGPFVIYQGSHGDRGAHRADVILPGAAYTEESGIFVNTEGRPQMALRAAFPPDGTASGAPIEEGKIGARENWAIIRALSGALADPQPWIDLDGLRAALFEAHPHLGRIDEVPQNDWQPLPEAPLGNGEFALAVDDFWLTNPIARASEVMAEMSRLWTERARKVAAE